MKENTDLQMADTDSLDGVLTPKEEIELMEDAKKFADDALDIVSAWEKGHGHYIYPIIIQAMKNLGNLLMQYEEHHLAKALQALQGVRDEKS